MTKVIKLQPVYRQNRNESSPRIVPKLTIQGKWLEEAGFEVADVVHVKMENGKLTIVNS